MVERDHNLECERYRAARLYSLPGPARLPSALRLQGSGAGWDRLGHRLGQRLGHRLGHRLGQRSAASWEPTSPRSAGRTELSRRRRGVY